MDLLRYNFILKLIFFLQAVLVIILIITITLNMIFIFDTSQRLHGELSNRIGKLIKNILL